MLFYPLIFLFAALLSNVIVCAKRMRSTTLLAASVLLSSFIPAFVAGCRDLTVGTDTSGYGVDIFNACAVSTSFADLCETMSSISDPGFLLVTFASVKLVPDIHFMLFAISFIQISVALCAIAKIPKPNHVPLGYLVYLFLYFNESLNMMRQSLALSFALLAVALLMERKVAWHYVSIGIAASVHASAVIALLFLPVMKMVEDDKWSIRKESIFRKDVGSLLKCAIVLLAPVILTVFFTQIIGILIGIGVLSSKYAAYLSGDTASSASMLVLLIYLAQFVCVSQFKSANSRFISVLLIYGVILYFLTGVSQYLWRVGSFFMYPAILALVECPRLDPRTSKINVQSVSFAVFPLIAIVFWALQIIVWGNHQTLPYTSVMLGMG